MVFYCCYDYSISGLISGKFWEYVSILIGEKGLRLISFDVVGYNFQDVGLEEYLFRDRIK